MLSYSIIEQVCDLSFQFHMIFYLVLYANSIQSYTHWNRVKYLTFVKSLNREKSVEIKTYLKRILKIIFYVEVLCKNL